MSNKSDHSEECSAINIPTNKDLDTHELYVNTQDVDPQEPTTPTTKDAITLNNAPKTSQNATTAPQVNLENLLNKSKRDFESMVIKYARSESENLQNKNKINDLDKKLKRAIKDNESLASRIRILTTDKNNITDTLNAKLAQLTVLEQRNNSLSSVQTVRLKELEEKCTQLETTNEELTKQIDTYKNKEGELLDFCERLSMKQMLLQAELDKTLQNAPYNKSQYEEVREENSRISQQYKDSLETIDKLIIELKEEKDSAQELRDEIDSLKLKYCHKIEELENEIKVMRRKQQIALKEMKQKVMLQNR